MVRIPAFIVLGFWIFGQFFSAPFSLESEGGTAYFAHIGGFIAGMILIPFFKKKETKLFNNKANSTWTVFQSKDNMINRDKNFLQDFINKSEKEIKNRK